MITLYTFGPFFGLPDASPFVMKGEMLLKLAKLEYQASTQGIHCARRKASCRTSMTTAPSSPTPRSSGCISSRSTASISIARLSARERGIAWATEKMLEDHLYWVLVYWRWMKDDNFAKGPANFFKRAPAFIRPLIIWKVRGNVRRNLHAHGIGRHNEAEMTAMSDRAFEALSQLLGDNTYLMGSQLCGADATAFAFIAGSLCPLFESPAHAKARALPNLIAYRDRMMAEFYPGFRMGTVPIC